MNYIIYDLETNGVNVLDNSIMQMTIIAMDGKILLNEYVYPFDGKIDAVHIHKIDEKKLRESNALTLVQLCCLVKNIIRNNYGRDDVTWVAYNNFGFDQIVFERSFKLVNNRMPDNWYFMDLMPLIKKKFPDLKPNYKLSTVYENLIGIKEGIHYHNSLDDCMCLLEIFVKCFEYHNEFKEYTRDKLYGMNIFNNKLNKLLYYNKYMNFEFHGIKTIGDLYNLYKTKGLTMDEFKNYLKTDLGMKNGFYAHNIANQINSIYELNK